MHRQTEYIGAERQTIFYSFSFSFSSSSSPLRHVNIFFVLHKCEIDWPVDRKKTEKEEKGINRSSNSSSSSSSSSSVVRIWLSFTNLDSSLITNTCVIFFSYIYIFVMFSSFLAMYLNGYRIISSFSSKRKKCWEFLLIFLSWNQRWWD